MIYEEGKGYIKVKKIESEKLPEQTRQSLNYEVAKGALV
jgi:hypothetical protein